MRLDPRTSSPATPPCSCGGRGQCFVCEARQAVRLSQLKRSAGGDFGAADFHTRNLLDRPMPMGVAPTALPVVRKMGALLGLPALRNAGPEDTASPLLSRANNLAGLLTLSLIKLPADRREAALEEIGGMGWAQGVLRAAGTMHGKLSAKDAVHFALTLEFIIGATDAQAGRFSPSGAAYVRAYNLMAKAQDEGRADSLGISKRSAMGGFGRAAGATTGAGAGTPAFTPTSANVPGFTPTAGGGTGTSRPGTGAGTPAPQKTPVSSVLAAGASLFSGGSWIRVSPNGRVALFVSGVGNGVHVVLKRGGDPIRFTEDVTPEKLLTFSDPQYVNLWNPAYFLGGLQPDGLTMGNDGTLRVYGKDRATGAQKTVRMWPLNPLNAKAGTRVEVQNDGNVVGYTPDNKVAFSFDTQQAAAPYLVDQFKAPPEIPTVDYNKFNVEYCQRINPSVEWRRQQKKDGIRVAFNRVFGRMPNNAEITHYGAMVWCIDGDGLLGGKRSSLENAMEVVRKRILDGEISTTTPPPSQRDMVDPNPPTWNPLTDLLSQGVQAINNVLCEGFKALAGTLGFTGDIGMTVANVLCQLISAFTTTAGNILASLTEVIIAVVKALIALVTGLGTGKPFDAIMGFMRELTVAVFFAVFLTGQATYGAGVAVTFLLSAGSTPESIKATQEKVRLMAYAAADKDPLFPLTLTITVISVIFMPTPQTVLQLAMVLVPVVSTLAAPTLQQIPALASTAVATIQKGLETLLRLAITVAMGIIAVSDLVATIQKQITESLAKDGPLQVIFCNMAGSIPQEPGDAAPPQQKSVAWCIAAVLKRVTRALDPKNPQSITAAIQKIWQGKEANGVVEKINNAAVGVLQLVPALLLVFAGGAIESNPSLQANINQYFITSNAVPGMLVDKQVVEVNTAMRDLLGMLSQLQQGDAVYEQQRILDLQTSAKVTAKALWERVGRDGVPQADRDLYFQTMRAEWTAAGGKV